MTLHTLHRTSAAILGVFVAGHVANHLAGVRGIDVHVAFMDSFRLLYRQPAVEALLLGCAAFQVVSGVTFVIRRWGERRGFFERAQALSGAYLGFFLIAHVAAVVGGRTWLNLDTNFYFAAAGMHVAPFQWYFIPYYFLAVTAVFVHVACAIYWLTRDRYSAAIRSRSGLMIIATGVIVSALIVTSLAGGLYPVEIPSPYRATYGAAP